MVSFLPWPRTDSHGQKRAPVEGRSGANQRLRWARLLKRVFEGDLEHFPNCCGELKIVATILEAPIIGHPLMNPGPQAGA